MIFADWSQKAPGLVAVSFLHWGIQIPTLESAGIWAHWLWSCMTWSLGSTNDAGNRARQDMTPAGSLKASYVIAGHSLSHMFQTWLVVWNMNFMTFHMLGLIIPTDFHIVQRGWNHQPETVWNMFQCWPGTKSSDKCQPHKSFTLRSWFRCSLASNLWLLMLQPGRRVAVGELKELLLKCQKIGAASPQTNASFQTWFCLKMLGIFPMK